ncbi:MAG: hypothetical protein JW954_06185 [Dehalococcoidaceae bacterium]|nr:hypothetical protein [Dehalococcoidaceae bacterium]
MADSSGSGRRKVTGSRRRPSSSSSTGRDRAGTPRRWTTTGSSGTSTGGSSSGGSGLSTGLGALGGLLSMLGAGSSGTSAAKGCLPRSKGCGLIGIVAIIILVVVVVISMQQCGGCDLFTRNPDQNPTTTQGGITTQPTTTTAPTTYIPSGDEHRWLVMLFQGADDNVLEKDIYMDLNEAEMVGSSGDVMIVAQIDRYSGGYSGDGNWTETRRYIVQKDDNLDRLGSQQVGSLGELNMASGQTLVDFATWAMQTYPADRYALIMSDHGMGWPGGWTDAVPAGSWDAGIPLASAVGDMIYLHELDDALGRIRAQTGIDKLDVIGLDACLMAQLEVFTALAPHALYAVASEETEPALGWAYAGFLQALQDNPGLDGAQLSRAVVESYIDDDLLIGSSREREQMSRDMTLTAVDLGAVAHLNSRLNQLAYVFQDASQRVIAGGRTYARSYTSVFGSNVPPSFVDLGSLLQIIKQGNAGSAVSEGINNVLAAINQVVVAEKHGIQQEGSTGIAIYFPNSELYRSQVTGAESYTAVAQRFADESLWDDFLAFHYTGRQFELSDAVAVVPPAGSVEAPAPGMFAVSSLQASDSTASWDRPVTLSADITGENIGYIYLFAGYLDEQANSIFIADQDYIASPDTRLTDGVYYPDWGEGDFALEFIWEPIVFAIDDGVNTAVALFKPESYGSSAEEALYSVDGVYTFASGGEQVYARMYFSNSQLQKVVGFSGSGTAGAPREITPAQSDQFTVTETWLDLDIAGNVVNTATQPGDTVTFGSQLVTWEVLDAARGAYMVGFVVEDLDGNREQSLIKITVE